MTNSLINDLGGFSQVGMVVKDAEKTIRYMSEQLGLGPFRVLSKVTLPNFWYRGAYTKSPVVTAAMAQAGPVQIEIIQQHDDTPSVYREFMSAGMDGCQHFAVWFSDRDAYEQAQSRLAANGLRLVQHAGSPKDVRFCYFSSEDPDHPMIELSDYTGRNARS